MVSPSFDWGSGGEAMTWKGLLGLLMTILVQTSHGGLAYKLYKGSKLRAARALELESFAMNLMMIFLHRFVIDFH